MTINNRDDTIDSRDVIERIEELQGGRDDLQSALDDAETDYNLAAQGDGDGTGELLEALQTAKNHRANFDEDKGDELKALESLQSEAEGYADDWRYGTQLIRRSYFVEYCRQLVEDIGDLPSGLPRYLADNINWEGVADDLEADYTAVEFAGVEYLVR